MFEGYDFVPSQDLSERVKACTGMVDSISTQSTIMVVK